MQKVIIAAVVVAITAIIVALASESMKKEEKAPVFEVSVPVNALVANSDIPDEDGNFGADGGAEDDGEKKKDAKKFDSKVMSEPTADERKKAVQKEGQDEGGGGATGTGVGSSGIGIMSGNSTVRANEKEIEKDNKLPNNPDYLRPEDEEKGLEPLPEEDPVFGAKQKVIPLPPVKIKSDGQTGAGGEASPTSGGNQENDMEKTNIPEDNSQDDGNKGEEQPENNQNQQKKNDGDNSSSQSSGASMGSDNGDGTNENELPEESAGNTGFSGKGLSLNLASNGFYGYNGKKSADSTIYINSWSVKYPTKKEELGAIEKTEQNVEVKAGGTYRSVVLQKNTLRRGGIVVTDNGRTDRQSSVESAIVLEADIFDII